MPTIISSTGICRPRILVLAIDPNSAGRPLIGAPPPMTYATPEPAVNVPSVAMNGGTLMRDTRIPLTQPTARPTTIATRTVIHT